MNKSFKIKNKKIILSFEILVFVFIVSIVNVGVHVKYKWRLEDKIWN
jgi:hypothetical protein